jgi:EpsI family protein
MDDLMSPPRRVVLCSVILTTGLAAGAGLEEATRIERPALLGPLSSVPTELGDWLGEDLALDADVFRESQADDYINRAYESRTRPGLRIRLWVNYSRPGNNLRHSPEKCLPSAGWDKVESECRVLPLDRPGANPLMCTRLVYSKGELAQVIGFWYYIFGEGRLEHFVRGLPITSRSSHGRTTRGSGMTIEVFCDRDSDADGEVLKDFARLLLPAIERLLPEIRAEYFIP